MTQSTKPTTPDVAFPIDAESTSYAPSPALAAEMKRIESAAERRRQRERQKELARLRETARYD